jgi:hypothetical protein
MELPISLTLGQIIGLVAFVGAVCFLGGMAFLAGALALVAKLTTPSPLLQYLSPLSTHRRPHGIFHSIGRHM